MTITSTSTDFDTGYLTKPGQSAEHHCCLHLCLGCSSATTSLTRVIQYSCRGSTIEPTVPRSDYSHHPAYFTHDQCLAAAGSSKALGGSPALGRSPLLSEIFRPDTLAQGLRSRAMQVEDHHARQFGVRDGQDSCLLLDFVSSLNAVADLPISEWRFCSQGWYSSFRSNSVNHCPDPVIIVPCSCLGWQFLVATRL